MGLVQTVAPTIQPVTLAEFKAHIRTSGDYEDPTLTIYLNSAVLSAEGYQKRQLINATYELTLSEFPVREICLPLPPLSSVTSIEYLDVAGDSQTWAGSNYQVDTTHIVGRVKPISTASFPSTQADTYNAVTVTYIAGYGATTATVPEETRYAILLWAAQMHEFRETIIAGTIIARVPDDLGIRAMLDKNRVAAF